MADPSLEHVVDAEKLVGIVAIFEPRTRAYHVRNLGRRDLPWRQAIINDVEDVAAPFFDELPMNVFPQAKPIVVASDADLYGAAVGQLPINPELF